MTTSLNHHRDSNMQQGQAQGHLGTVVVLDEGVVELGLGVVRDPELVGFGFGVELDVACRKGWRA